MQKITIVVPTYWTWPIDVKGKEENSIFDHPTPLNLEGTLARTLESFKKINYPDFDVLVITASTNIEIVDKVEEKVQGIIDNFKDDLTINHFSYSKLKLLRERLLELGHHKILEEINLENYNNIRNLQLIIPYINNSDLVVGIDDDEIITDSDYLYKAVEYIGKDYQGELVAGVAGYYLDKEGNHRLKVEGQERFKNLFDKKIYLMDATYNMLDNREGRLVKSPIVFGGNMVIPRSTIEKVSFDPYNTRGEDIDYLINAKMEGLHFFLDKELNIVHLPPEYDNAHNSINLSKLKQDILRFVYEKEKIEQVEKYDDLNNIDIEELMPYPGSFFADEVFADAEDKLKRALSDENNPEKEAQEFIVYAQERAKKLAPKYFEFRLLWKDMIKDIKDDQKLRDIIS
ncbi:MAG: hypothetical protein PWR10_2400 [Halanaerobiales bacterium]|nr:hypothetical protein [Halanaerobiales bacterium]